MQPHGLVDRLVARARRRPTRAYYRWTQWIFLRLFERGLAYKHDGARQLVPVVPDGAGQRAGHRRRTASAAASAVEAKHAVAVVLPITDYAQRLLDDMALLENWPERVLTMQRNWIGRSRGRRGLFRQPDLDERHPGLHDAARHAVRRDVLRAGARAPAGRPTWSRGTDREAEVLDYVRRTAARERRRSARRRTRPASTRAARSSTRSPASRSRSGSPTTC